MLCFQEYFFHLVINDIKDRVFHCSSCISTCDPFLSRVYDLWGKNCLNNDNQRCIVFFHSVTTSLHFFCHIGWKAIKSCAALLLPQNISIVNHCGKWLAWIFHEYHKNIYFTTFSSLFLSSRNLTARFNFERKVGLRQSHCCRRRSNCDLHWSSLKIQLGTSFIFRMFKQKT